MMKRILSLVLSFILICSFSCCGVTVKEFTEEEIAEQNEPIEENTEQNELKEETTDRNKQSKEIAAQNKLRENFFYDFNGHYPFQSAVVAKFKSVEYEKSESDSSTAELYFRFDVSEVIFGTVNDKEIIIREHIRYGKPVNGLRKSIFKEGAEYILGMRETDYIVLENKEYSPLAFLMIKDSGGAPVTGDMNNEEVIKRVKNAVMKTGFDIDTYPDIIRTQNKDEIIKNAELILKVKKIDEIRRAASSQFTLEVTECLKGEYTVNGDGYVIVTATADTVIEDEVIVALSYEYPVRDAKYQLKSPYGVFSLKDENYVKEYLKNKAYGIYLEDAAAPENNKTLSETVAKSNFAVTAQFISSVKNEDKVSFEFKLKDIIYGRVPSENFKIEAAFSEDAFNKDNEYLLFLCTENSAFCSEPEVSFSVGSVCIDLNALNNSFYEKGKVKIAEVFNNEDVKNYVKHIALTMGFDDSLSRRFDEYDSEETVVKFCDFVMYVKVNDLNSEKGDYCEYNCTVQSTLKGIYSGDVKIAAVKDTLKVGEEYLIALTKSGEENLLYQASPAVTYKADDKDAQRKVKIYLLQRID